MLGIFVKTFEELPPPVIDSARLVLYAHNDPDVLFTDRIELHVGGSGGFQRLGEMPELAICSNYTHPQDVLLMFCDNEWDCRGVIAVTSVEEAKLQAERGYKGITAKWKEAPYSDQQVADFLRDEWQVDPNSEWWKLQCSFCRKQEHEVETLLMTERASICKGCVSKYHNHFLAEDA